MSETIFDAGLEVAMQLAHNVAPPTKILEIPLTESAGYVLAKEVLASSDLPPFNASMVDGYAISGDGPWKLIGKNLAGETAQFALTENECIYIATGAALPENTFAVIKQEDCEIHDEIISAKVAINSGMNIRPKGVEAKQNQIVIPAGTKLTPALLGLASACGLLAVSIYQKPKVAVLIFGDELIFDGISGNGKVRDSIGPQISQWIDHLGGQVVEIKYVADNLVEHISAIQETEADLIITTGGTASGPVDYLHEAIGKCSGTLLIDAVLVRPGYHQLLAQLPNKFLIGLPGNPQSAVVGLHTLVSPFIAGTTSKGFQTPLKRVISVDQSAPAHEHKFVLCREIKSTESVGLVEPVDYLDSSMLRGFVFAEGYAVISPGGQKAGTLVDWIALPK